ncbi:MAG: lycopene cyclase domain-containing protein [Candidatus Caenarcaniphilales bacterium]|nr:lycopene cyclase domain-containing protein [Candidatus Caenarcaniphilales bacterium]
MLALKYSYLLFHCVFILPPLIGLLLITKPRIADWGRLLLVAVIAISYTLPWDNHLIEKGVWTYPREDMIWVPFEEMLLIPLEEYLFMFLQTLLTGCLILRLRAYPIFTKKLAEPKLLSFTMPIVWVLLTALGFRLWNQGHNFYYLGITLAWAAPIIALQWLIGGKKLAKSLSLVAYGILIPTIYLCIADRIAIGWRVWQIEAAYSTGIKLLGLPIEEIVFFFVTNTLIVQGLLLSFSDETNH